jgi:hypothetical protein
MLNYLKELCLDSKSYLRLYIGVFDSFIFEKKGPRTVYLTLVVILLALGHLYMDQILVLFPLLWSYIVINLSSSFQQN